MVPTSLTALIRIRLLRGLLWLWNWCVRQRINGIRTAISLLWMIVCSGLSMLSLVNLVSSICLWLWLRSSYEESCRGGICDAGLELSIVLLI